MRRQTERHYLGCLLGGAVGDALGAAVEFMSLVEIRRRFGPDGLTDYAPAYGRLGAITDDTQMTLFTAEGLLHSPVHEHYRRPCSRWSAAVVTAVHRAYLRWLHTQGRPWNRRRMGKHEGLVNVRELEARRAPGNTCLGALDASLKANQPAPIDSKGCGGVMRMAPAGLVLPLSPFWLGCRLAGITHGHPAGYLPAGFLAQLTCDLVTGDSLEGAVGKSMERLLDQEDHEETAAAIQRALELARGGSGVPEEVERLGQGWEGHEALAIALYCALRARSFSEGVLLAVNHGGDSDSTGAIAGNILGLVHGVDAIPGPWLDQLELREVIEKVALDLLELAGKAASAWQVPGPAAGGDRDRGSPSS